MIQPVFSTTLTGFPLVGGYIISDFEFSDATGSTELVAVSYGGDTFARFDLSGSGVPTFDQNLSLSPGGTPIGLGASIEFVTLDGVEYTFFSGYSGSNTPIFIEAGDGTLTPGSSILGDLGLFAKVSAISHTQIDGNDFLFAVDHSAGVLQSFSIVGGALELAAGGPIPTNLGSPRFIDLGTIFSNGNHYAVAIDQSSNTVFSYRSDTSGNLVLTDIIGADDGIGINNPTQMETAQVGGRSFAIVASSGSSALSVFEINSTGGLVATDHVLDDANTRFQGATRLSLIEENGRIFVLAAGSDDGFSLFTLLPNGRLYHEASIADTASTSLMNASALAGYSDGNTLSIYSASQSEIGISHFQADISALGSIVVGDETGNTLNGASVDDILSGEAGNDTLTALAGADILMDGYGQDTMSGGAGADTFVLSYDQNLDRITDFDTSEDTLDLSNYPLFHSFAQLSISSTSWGATITYAGDVTDIYTHDGSSLNVLDFFSMTLKNLDRLPTNEISIDQHMIGTADADTLYGCGESKRMQSGGGNMRFYPYLFESI